MNATTDLAAARPAPARWSKLVASALSAGALLGIVHLLSATAQRPVAPTADDGRSSGTQAATIMPTAPAPAAAVPAPVPAPAPASAAPAAPLAPHAISKASGG